MNWYPAVHALDLLGYLTDLHQYCHDLQSREEETTYHGKHTSLSLRDSDEPLTAIGSPNTSFLDYHFRIDSRTICFPGVVKAPPQPPIFVSFSLGRQSEKDGDIGKSVHFVLRCCTVSYTGLNFFVLLGTYI